MQAAAKFPLDLTDLSVFRVLKDSLGGKSKAIQFFWSLWRDLAQLAIEGQQLGRMRRINVNAFVGDLVDEGFFENNDSGVSFCFEQAVTAGLFQIDGEELVCPRFIILNPELSYRPRESRGGHGRSFASKQKKMEENFTQMGLRLPGSIFRYPDGNPMAHEFVERIQRLIYSCDNALKRERPEIGWTEGLVTLAIPVVEKYNDHLIEQVCRKVALSYGHPNLHGMTTEKLLPRFSTIIKELGED